MGGVAIIGSTVFGYIVAHVADRDPRAMARPTASGLLLLFLMVGLGVVGFLDDFIKIRRQRSLGLRARAKFGGQLRRRGDVRGARAAVPQQAADSRPASTHLSYVRDISRSAGRRDRVRRAGLPDRLGHRRTR